MPNRSFVFFAALSLSLSAALLSAADAPKFRTDANPDKSLPWFQLVDGKFPPEN